MFGKWIVTQLLVAVLLSGLVSAHQAYSADSGIYNPATLYPGKFKSDMLYYRSRPKGNWQRGMNGAFPASVHCVEAKQSLEKTGLWHGTLRLDGSCVTTDEPSDWATGNRLNFNKENLVRVPIINTAP